MENKDVQFQTLRQFRLDASACAIKFGALLRVSSVVFVSMGS